MIFASSHSNFHLKLSSEEVDLNLLQERYKTFSYFESIINTVTLAKFYYMLWVWTAPKGPCIWILGSYVVRIWNCSRWGWNRLLDLESYNHVICLASTFYSLLGVNMRNWLKVPAFQDQASPSCHLSYCDGRCPLWMWANIILSLQMLI